MARRRPWILPWLLLGGIFALPAFGAFPRAYARSHPDLLPPGSTALGVELRCALGAPGRLLAEALDLPAPERPMVALTFDDGPYPLYTPALLDVLRRHHARATFFLTGSGARDFPGLARLIAEEGHEVGNHTFSHRQESELTAVEVEGEILAAEEAIARVVGVRTRLFRPAGGRLTPTILETAGRLGYTTVMETVNPGDWWIKDPGELYRRMFQGRIREGIVLLHSGSSGTIRALPAVLQHLEGKGVRFVTVSDLARARGMGPPRRPGR